MSFLIDIIDDLLHKRVVDDNDLISEILKKPPYCEIFEMDKWDNHFRNMKAKKLAAFIYEIFGRGNLNGGDHEYYEELLKLAEYNEFEIAKFLKRNGSMIFYRRFIKMRLNDDDDFIRAAKIIDWELEDVIKGRKT